LSDLQGIVVHSATPPAGKFNSSSSVINQIQHNIQWGQLSNLMSVPSDCPQRDERKGWMGDSALSVDEALFNFKLAPFFTNWVQNIRDAQRNDGAVPDTVPLTFGSARGDPNWGTAYPTVVYFMYHHYGDQSILKNHYNGIKAWVDFLTSEYTSTGLANMYYNYGDWVPPPPNPRTNSSLCSAFSFALDVKHFVEIAQILGNSADQIHYNNLYNKLILEFHKVFYDSTNQGYAGNLQTANVLALYLPGLVPPSIKPLVAQTLLNDISKNKNHLTTGIIGTRFLFDVLAQLGHSDVALSILTRIDYPSYGYMFNNPYENATTLWELWDAPFSRSRNELS